VDRIGNRFRAFVVHPCSRHMNYQLNRLPQTQLTSRVDYVLFGRGIQILFPKRSGVQAAEQLADVTESQFDQIPFAVVPVCGMRQLWFGVCFHAEQRFTGFVSTLSVISTR